MLAYKNTESVSTTTCLFCSDALCAECEGCKGDCPAYHSCQCWTLTNERGEVTDVIPAKRCAGCGYPAPEIFLSGGICPDCRGLL